MKMFDADKSRMIGYRMVKKLRRYVKPFSSDTGTLRTDGRTDRFAISISRVSMLAHDNKLMVIYNIGLHCTVYTTVRRRLGGAAAQALLAVPTVTAHPSTANHQVYQSPYCCTLIVRHALRFNVPIKWLIDN